MGRGERDANQAGAAEEAGGSDPGSLDAALASTSELVSTLLA